MILPELLVQTIPSPSEGTWYLGPLPVRGYALSIILGIVFAIWLGERRWVARGGKAGDVSDLAIWARHVHNLRNSYRQRGLEREVRIYLDPSQLQASGVSINEVLGALGRQNLEVPAGRVERDAREDLVSVTGRITDVKTIIGTFWLDKLHRGDWKLD